MLVIDQQQFSSHLLLGSSQYPSLDCLSQSIKAAGSQILTVSITRETQTNSPNCLWDFLQSIDCHLLPNTAGSRTAKQAIHTANLCRELFSTRWIKLEVMADDFLLHPHATELIAAAKELIAQDFFIFPYCSDDLSIAQQLVELGCEVLMPWAAPIGSGLGITNRFALTQFRRCFSDVTLIVDAGIQKPSQACDVLEMGFDAVLVNSAIAQALDPIAMASAFGDACAAGVCAANAGFMPQRPFAHATTPVLDVVFE